MLAGCGSVGGYAALAFARVGVGKLTLVDPDRMKPENIFRHVLGRSAVGKPKVNGLLGEIRQKYPYVTVDVHELDLVSAMVAGNVRISQHIAGCHIRTIH